MQVTEINNRPIKRILTVVSFELAEGETVSVGGKIRLDYIDYTIHGAEMIGGRTVQLSLSID